MRTLLKNCTIVRPEESFPGSVLVEGETIAAVLRAGDPLPEADCVENLSGGLLLPGMIDSHVHIRGGVLSHREDFLSGSEAAALGGVTTLLEMPVAKPPASTSEALLGRMKEVSQNTIVDVGLYGGAGFDNLSQIQGLKAAGAVAFKTFMMPPVPGREAEFYGLCCENRQALFSAMAEVATTGLPLCVHAEDSEIVATETRRVMGEGKNGLLAFSEARPKNAEVRAVKTAIEGARETGCKVVICHLSTPEATQLVLQAQKDGLPVFGETCPHYLLFDVLGKAACGVFARMKPPLRLPSDRDAMQVLYRNRAFSATGSDHAPYLYEEKLQNGQDIFNTFDGLCGLELSLPLLLNLVATLCISPEVIAYNTAQAPAKLFSLEKKGLIQVGYHADFAVAQRLATPQPLDINTLRAKAKKGALLYEGIPMHYKISGTMLRGQWIMREQKLLARAGSGTVLRPVQH